MLDAGQIVQADDHVAAADVDVVLEHERDGLRAERLLQRAVVGPDFLHGASRGRWAATMTFWPTRTMPPAIWPLKPRKSCSARIGRIVRAVDPLHGQAEAVQIPVAGDVHGFQMAEQRRAGIPRRVRRGVDDVVAVERADAG